MVDFEDDFSSYSVSKLPTFRDDFAGIDNWQQSGTTIAVNLGTDQVDWDFSRDNINKAISVDLGVVNNESWVLRWKFIVNNFANISTSATGGWIGLYSDDHSVDSTTNQSFLHCFIRNANIGATQEIRMVQSDGTFPPENGQFDVEFTHTYPIATAEYYELKRESPTSYRLSIYSDSKYTDLIETQSFATSSAVNGLRYLKIAGFNFSTIAQTFDGNIDDIEFWDGRSLTPTFEDRFDMGDNWVDTGTGFGVNVGTEKLDVSLVLNGSDNHTSFDLQTILGGGNFADSDNWVLRFKINISSITKSGQTGVTFAISDTEAGGGIGLAQDSFSGAFDVFSSLPEAYGVGNTTGNNAALPLQTDPAFKQIVAISTDGSTDYYVELKRINIQTQTMRVFIDPNFTKPLAGLSSKIVSPLITNLRYIKFFEREISSSGTLVYTIDDITFYDGVQFVPKEIGAQQGDVTAQDDFSIDRFVETGTLNQVNVGTGVLDFDFDRDSTNHKTVRDLISTSDDNWVLRWCQTNDAVTQTGTPSTLGYIGMISTDNTIPANGTNDFIGLECFVDDVNNACRLIDADGTALSSGTVRYTFTEVNAVNTRYWEVKRLSATEIIASVYSDSEYTTLIETSGIQTTVSTVSGLQYIGVITDNQATSVSVHNGTIDDIEFYDRVSVAKTPIVENKKFEDRFELDNWTDVGTGVGVNVGTKVMDWSSAIDGVNNSSVFDLGNNQVSETAWALRFKYTTSGLTAGDSTGKYFWIGLFSGDETVNSEQAQDAIAFYFQVSSGSPNGVYSLAERNSVLLSNAGTNSNLAQTATASDIFYIELKRVSGTLAELTLYRDPDYTQVIERTTLTITTGIQNLRYIGLKNRAIGASTGSMTGTIDDVIFWTGLNAVTNENIWRSIDL